MNGVEKLIILLKGLSVDKAIVLVYLLESRKHLKLSQVIGLLGSEGMLVAFRLKRIGVLRYEKATSQFCLRDSARPLVDKLLNYYDLDSEMEEYVLKLSTL